ncbi:hypothetical protein PVK06_044567 [Gossypium arboreum]|uniref:Uncharacterized protein n=1 Tax=Gossypium arboreum TaxID=29729 RepID=A0ABR0MRJ0_GOSAR|nr:hypothetical protein PVK06_044567 [Gossypium arboreum]
MASTGGGSPAKENGFSGLRGVGGRVTNKVRLREDDPSDEGGMCIDTSEGGRISFKDSLLDSFRNVEGQRWRTMVHRWWCKGRQGRQFGEKERDSLRIVLTPSEDPASLIARAFGAVEGLGIGLSAKSGGESEGISKL